MLPDSRRERRADKDHHRFFKNIFSPLTVKQDKMAIERIIELIKEEQASNRIDKDRLMSIIMGMADELGGTLSGGGGGSGGVGPRGPPGPAGPAGPKGDAGECKCPPKKATTTKKAAAKNADA
jgi:hypothetical protein